MCTICAYICIMIMYRMSKFWLGLKFSNFKDFSNDTKLKSC